MENSTRKNCSKRSFQLKHANWAIEIGRDRAPAKALGSCGRQKFEAVFVIGLLGAFRNVASGKAFSLDAIAPPKFLDMGQTGD